MRALKKRSSNAAVALTALCSFRGNPHLITELIATCEFRGRSASALKMLP
jgi:hypothetical protein